MSSSVLPGPFPRLSHKPTLSPPPATLGSAWLRSDAHAASRSLCTQWRPPAPFPRCTRWRGSRDAHRVSRLARSGRLVFRHVLRPDSRRPGPTLMSRSKKRSTTRNCPVRAIPWSAGVPSVPCQTRTSEPWCWRTRRCGTTHGSYRWSRVPKQKQKESLRKCPCAC